MHERRRWRNGTILEFYKSHPANKILLGQSIKHLVKVWKVLMLNLKPGRLLLLCILLESFGNIPAIFFMISYRSALSDLIIIVIHWPNSDHIANF